MLKIQNPLNKFLDFIANKGGIAYCFVSYILVFPVYRLFFRGKTLGNLNVPLTGPLIVVSNHGSDLDPPILGHSLGRPISFMAKKELFQIPLLSNVIKACGAYPVERGSSDRKAIRAALEVLGSNKVIGLFLDGTRQNNGRVNKPMAGAALLAAKSGAKLLPVAIVNSHRAFGKNEKIPRFIPIHVRIGEVVDPPVSTKKNDLVLTTNKIKDEINKMLDIGVIKT